MLSIKTVAVAVALATSVAAYSAPLEARNDLDLTPDNLEILFGRDIDIDSDNLELLARDLDIDVDSDDLGLLARDPDLDVDSDDLELLARELDVDAEDLDTLLARGFRSSVKSGINSIRRHKHGIGRTLSAASDMYNSYLRDQQPRPVNQARPQIYNQRTSQPRPQPRPRRRRG